MIRVRETFTVDCPINKAFDYIATVDNFSRWDPIIVSVGREGAGPVSQGDKFDIDVRLLGPSVNFDYVVAEMNRPRFIQLEGEGRFTSIVDKIQLDQLDDGRLKVIWIAEVSLSGPSRVLEPMIELVLARTGEAAIRNLRTKIAAL